MAKQIIVSHEGLKKLQQELEYLKTVKRKEVAQAIQKARAYGDLSENSEYDEAKNEQAEIEGKIANLEATLENAIVLDDAELGTDKVNVGNKVAVHNIDTDEESEYKIVSTAEADPIMGLISDDSPLGKALIGQRKGDSVNVETPMGVVKYTITNISK
ncbi:MAG: transcription elongation factor GreA [Clostridia bacterium]|jgi:transcription elongation factor GreA|nr:transcription elongation factor GreA [Clostridia bacterium]MBO5785839.1 transcription elongation factor GreA [Clostridia bacterium]MBO5914562.1 transcription elongation factor GreA [Clostridia bacterium]